ncbi:hypothetical protein ATCC90586_002410 [Pythium insidiosum]|nr:hypothetical protein ATCC90586_002410 [Pythium insidiosum]
MASITPSGSSSPEDKTASPDMQFAAQASDSSQQNVSDISDSDHGSAASRSSSASGLNVDDIVIKTEPTERVDDTPSLPLSCDGYEPAIWAQLFDVDGIDAIDVDDEPMPEIKTEPNHRESLATPDAQTLFMNTAQPTPMYIDHWHHYLDEDLSHGGGAEFS